MPVRSAHPAFLAAVDAWWGALLPRLAPLTYERGGPIIMVQVGEGGLMPLKPEGMLAILLLSASRRLFCE
jgi:hypothetical protein